MNNFLSRLFRLSVFKKWNNQDIKGLKESEAHQSIYQSLTASGEVELGEYQYAILSALNNPEIKNIAITGPYGSGKSSVLKTFERRYEDHDDFKFLNVSLATFNIDEEKNISTLEAHEKIKLNSDIEKSLLQQIFYKASTSQLEGSNFSRITPKKYLKLPFNLKFLSSKLGIAFFLIAFVSSIGFLLYPDSAAFKGNLIFKKEYILYFQVYIFISATALIQSVLNNFPKLGLSKLSAAGTQITFNEKKGDSILNKFIDEIINFFVNTPYNIVVFEDLDRFPSKEILIKLREVNILLNNSNELIQINKQIKFVFALGDDVFNKDIDRTKFFDFIIPIIPVVNAFNAEEKLSSVIKKSIS